MFFLAVGAIALAVTLLCALPMFVASDKADVRSTLRAATEAADGALGVPTGRRASTTLAQLVAGAVGAFALRFSPKGYVTNARSRLALAGRGQPGELQRFLITRALTVAAVPAVVIVSTLLPLGRKSALLFMLFIAVLLILGPEALLNRRITERKETIRRELADLIDLLNIGVQAGLGFEQALSRTAAAVPGELSEEFARLLSETRVGADRRAAFEGVIERTDVPELRAFLLALAQAEEFGISISQILSAQAVEMRVSRRQLAQEKAQKAPVKMLFPLVFCILPTLFIVIVGPAAIEIYRTVVK